MGQFATFLLLLASVSTAAIGAGAAAGQGSAFKYLAGALGQDVADPLGIVQMDRSGSGFTAPGLPSRWDWRDVDGKNFLSPPRDQGICGSCVSFAAIDTLETQLNIARNSAAHSDSLSRQFLFSCAGGSCRSGMDMGRAVAFLQSSGVPEEACLPYFSGAFGTEVQCSEACSEASARAVHILSYTQPSDGIVDVVAIKKALLLGPVLTSVILYEDLMYYKGGVYRQKEGLKLGSHAVAFVGWDDADKVWIVRNSFGPEWGEGGYFRIAWDDANALPGRYTWKFEVGADRAGYATFLAPSARQVVRGTVPLQVHSTFPGTVKVEWYVAQSLSDIVDDRATIKGTMPERNLVEGGLAPAANGEPRLVAGDILDTRGIADGKYILLARVFHQSGVAETIPQEIYVLNGPLNGSISFTNVAEGSQLSGMRKLGVAAPSSPVPFQELILTVKSEQTGEVLRKATQNVAAQTTLQWATRSLPNGSYRLSLEASAGGQSVRSEAIKVDIVNRASP